MGSIGLGGQAIANAGNENRPDRGNRSCGYVGQRQYNEAIAIWPDSILAAPQSAQACMIDRNHGN